MGGAGGVAGPADGGDGDAAMRPAAAPAHGAAGPRPSLIERRRRAGHDPRPFGRRQALPWFLFGGGVLGLLVVGPALWPGANPWVERIATVLALVFFLAAFGYWMRMQHRALAVAAVLVAVLYGATAWAPVFEVRDVFFLTILVGLFLFTLAGFNFLFILEEIVYDIHRMLPRRHPAWAALPALAVVALLALLPLSRRWDGPATPTLDIVLPAVALLLAAAWIARWWWGDAGMGILREVHLLVVGAVAGAGLADAVALLRGTGLLVSFVGYAGILVTWMYISFTSLQRAQYFLRARDVKPWVCLLLSASFAVVAHTHAQFELGGERALVDLWDVRVLYLVLGVWVGLGFFVVRGLWRVLRFVRDEARAGRRTRIVAGRLARVAEGILLAEHRVGDVTYQVYRGVDRVLPGRPAVPERPSYPPLDAAEGSALMPYFEWEAGGEEE